MSYRKTIPTHFQENSEPIFCNSSFTFKTAEQAAIDFSDNPDQNYIYSRFGNPTTTAFANCIAQLEGGECALPTASGMAAILSLILGVCQSGDKIVCGANVFGATFQLLSKQIAKFNINIDFVYDNSTSAWIEKLNQCDNVRLVLLETPSNPMHNVVDIAAIAAIAHKKNMLFAVDNCLCPYLQTPLKLGADIVVGSSTKYIDGQGRVLGGYIVGSTDILQEKIFPFIRCGGPALSPFNAWVLLKSIETLPLRIEKHSQSANTIAHWLKEQPQIAAVYYTGLATHPAHELAMYQQSSMGGGIVTLALKGDKKEAFCFINALKIFTITANFGDARSIVTHPATTTHLRVPQADREKIGLTNSIVRLSIGLEPVELLQDDINQALACLMH